MAKTVTAAAAPADGMTSRLSNILAAACTRFDDCPHAGLTIVCGGWLRTGVASDRLGAELDAAQYQFSGVPDAHRRGNLNAVRSDDLSLDTSWSPYSRFATDRGIRSMLVCRYAPDPHLEVALSLYSTRPASFDDDAVATARELILNTGPALASAMLG
jgi:hypothetical protein